MLRRPPRSTRTDTLSLHDALPISDGNGVELIGEIKEKQPLSEVILLTAYGNITDGVQAIKNGAFDYIVKGDDNNRIIPLLHKRSEEHTSELQSLMRISYAVFCLKKKKIITCKLNHSTKKKQ